MRVCVYSDGAMGAILGAYLSKANAKWDLFNPSQEHVDVLNEHGAHVLGTVDFVQSVRAFLPSQMVGQYDVIFLLTKQEYGDTVAQFLRQHLSPLGIVVTLQNGIPEPKLVKVLGINHVLGCVANWRAKMLAFGQYILETKPDKMLFRMEINTYVSSTIRTEIIRMLAPICLIIMDSNFVGTRWSNILMESALSGLSAVVGGTFGDVVKDKRLRRLAIECMRETAEIGETNGVFFEPINGQNIVPLLLDDHQFSKRALDLCLLKMVKPYFHIESPMLQDIRSHQRCDTRAIQGTICEYGDRYGIEAPINRRIESVLIQMERGEMPIMYDNYRILMMP